MGPTLNPTERIDVFACSKICLPVFALFITLAAPGRAAATAAGVEQEPGTAAPLSPYFFLEGDDSGVERLPLKKTGARVSLNGFIARVQLTQLYRNEGTRPINATYVFPGSTRAAVNGMTMTIGERRIVARIREKEDAAQEFRAARDA